MPQGLSVLAEQARDTVQLRVGEPLVEGRLHDDARRVEAALADASYAFAKVVERAEVSVSQRKARVEYRVAAGPKAVFGDVKLEGTASLDRDVIRGVLGIEKGDPYSKRELDAAQRRLFALGVFSSVDIKPDLKNPENPAVPMRVTVVVGPTSLASSCGFGMIADTSSKTASRTIAPSEICGVSRSVMPTSSRSMVAKVLLRLVSLVARLATKGTFWPTTISASSLSVVSTFGAERMLMSLALSRARKSAACAGTVVPSGSVIVCFDLPKGDTALES